MQNDEHITQAQKENLDIPPFLKRNKDSSMMTNTEHAPAETSDDGVAREPEITLEMILGQIKRLSDKRDEIQATLSGLKKQAQKMIGAL